MESSKIYKQWKDLVEYNGFHVTVILSGTLHLLYLSKTGAPVAQWVNRWPTDLAVPSSIPARGEIFFFPAQ